jgi:hypothetical protein
LLSARPVKTWRTILLLKTCSAPLFDTFKFAISIKTMKTIQYSVIFACAASLIAVPFGAQAGDPPKASEATKPSLEKLTTVPDKRSEIDKNIEAGNRANAARKEAQQKEAARPQGRINVGPNTSVGFGTGNTQVGNPGKDTRREADKPPGAQIGVEVKKTTK